VKINLLFRANQLGKKISKLSLWEEEYLRAIIVKGQNILNVSSTSPSPIINAMAIQVSKFTWFKIPEIRM
jgi:hypothetical protein